VAPPFALGLWFLHCGDNQVLYFAVGIQQQTKLYSIRLPEELPWESPALLQTLPGILLEMTMCNGLFYGKLRTRGAVKLESLISFSSDMTKYSPIPNFELVSIVSPELTSTPSLCSLFHNNADLSCPRIDFSCFWKAIQQRLGAVSS